jgi:DNA-binding NtrC family response regulator
VAAADVPVLVTGDNGVGKEKLAEIVQANSSRRDGAFVRVNAGALPDELLESELFGAEAGAYTGAVKRRVGRFEAADGGTLFLDEIANVPASQQGKLLRVLETGEFERLGSSRTRHADVRLLSATNADPAAEVASGRFRQDLLFRLNTIEIRLPPLSSRREDIPILAAQFLRLQARRYRKDISGFDPAAMQALLSHSWPGNVRELEHAVERSVLMATGSEIRATDLALRRPEEAGAAPRLEDMSLEEVESLLIRKTMERFGGNVSQAARALGLSRSALYRRLERHGY